LEDRIELIDEVRVDVAIGVLEGRHHGLEGGRGCIGQLADLLQHALGLAGDGLGDQAVEHGAAGGGGVGGNGLSSEGHLTQLLHPGPEGTVVGRGPVGDDALEVAIEVLLQAGGVIAGQAAALHPFPELCDHLVEVRSLRHGAMVAAGSRSFGLR